MKPARIFAVVIIVLVIAGLASVSFIGRLPVAPQSTTNSVSASEQGDMPTGTASLSGQSSQSSLVSGATAKQQSLTVHVNDLTADIMTIAVAKGAPVALTFDVGATDVYYGGLDLRSPVVNSGTIKPGASKTVNFTALHSFSFTPYWPASNVAKPYKINIVVK